MKYLASWRSLGLNSQVSTVWLLNLSNIIVTGYRFAKRARVYLLYDLLIYSFREQDCYEHI